MMPDARVLPTADELGLVVPPISSQSSVYGVIRKHAQFILGARILVVDPSIGSMSSQPGYAIYESGRLTDCGIIEIRASGSHNARLFELSRSLREDFGAIKPDVLVVEAIPMLRFNKYGRSLAAQVPLHRAVGAILSAIPVPVVLEIPPITWRRFFDPARYIKGDTADAICMGHAVLCMSQHALEHNERRTKKSRHNRASKR